jgi:cyclopropane fatty-acyl-phospholipid synthase-like methyltransferase
MRNLSERIDPKRVVEKGYDQVAQKYSQLEGEVEWPRMRWLRKVLRRLEPGAAVLDLGCGAGDPADIKIAKDHKVFGVDISGKQIDLARQNVPEGIFIQGDAGTVDFAREFFEAVVSFYTLEHIPRKEHLGILKRIHSWLKPKGLVLISIEAGDYDDHTGEWLGVPMFISCYDPETMWAMVKDAGYEIIETAIENQVEGGSQVPFLWILGQKSEGV